MTAPPPLSRLMRDAADILEQASERMAWQKDAAWRPTELRHEAGHVEDEDREKAEQEALVQELAALIDNLDYVCCSSLSALQLARTIIESGWGKP